ncbi:5'-methylthioadenosine phosphorylase [Marinobacter confluentis]|uniref:5'-methylthioadenosine phosphorylase n=2 Tax=Marinobacter confluentis TaxID=1697557 RepID=A0A4Z1C632_9GAMM|nr:5'-methylthioadenosine phosphorylase [Marinobacter confluentis]
MPLQTPGRPTPRTPVLTLAATIAAILAFAPSLQAQQTAQTGEPAPRSQLTPAQQALAQDFYRAEFVILERKVEPADINEKMAGRVPEPPAPGVEEILRHTSENGDTRTTLKLVPQSELHLNSAAERLERSGRYRVLLAEGWYQGFPPDFEGEPLWVTIGDWLPEAKHTDVQGTITIDRQRYLHVDVQLNHWVPKSSTDNLLGLDLNAETPSRPRPPVQALVPGSSQLDSAEPNSAPGLATTAQGEQPLIAGLNWPRAELLTWIQETRRMRSEEVHFLDSPTLGVLIFFKKIEPEDAAPLIRKLGLSGEQATQEAR